MAGFCVFLVGNTYYADHVADMLRASGEVDQLELFGTIREAIQPIQDSPPNVLILVDVDALDLKGDTPFLPIRPEIPVIFTDIHNTTMKLITTTNISANRLDLLQTISAVKRGAIRYQVKKDREVT